MLEWFRAFSPARQLVLIAVGVCIISLLLGSIWYFLLRTKYEPLFTNLRAADAETIVSDLDKKKIPYLLENGGATILVPEDKVAATRLNVMTADLPLKGTVGFELFDKSDMGLTDFTQKINYQRALQGELERTIMTLDGVDSARVHLSMGEDRIFRDDRVPPKASVTVRMKHDARLPASAAQGIQRLVAAAVPKLDMANVVILNEEGQVVGSAPSNSIAVESAAPDVQEKRAIEQYYEARIREALENAHSGDDIRVKVHADAADATLETWTPGARKFPLQVTLTSESPLDTASQGNLRGLAVSAIGSDAVNADVVGFEVIADSENVPYRNAPRAYPGRTGRAMSAPGSISDGEPGWFGQIALGVLPLVALAGFFLLIWRARGPRRLTERQRADFAARLRTALEKGDARVTSQP